ncbi:MAG: transglycosylase family protein [Actinomycetota bacterium]
MSRKWRYPAALALIVGVSLPVAATGTERGALPGPAQKQPVTIKVLKRPVKRLHATIDLQVRKIRAEQHRNAFANLPGGVSLSTLEAIAACESGGDPTSVSSDGSYRGKYQFDYGTWASVGGSGDPAAAPEAEQDYRAALLYAQSGSSPWPICGA